MSALSEYLRELSEINSVGVEETSGYGALERFLNAAGQSLKPAVRCVLHPQSKSKKTLLPDGGLFTRDQLQTLGRDFEPDKALQMNPARGALEVKGLNASLDELIASAQVQKYLDQFGKILCTNYRAFAVVEQREGVKKILERYELAASESEFRKLAKNHAEGALHGERVLAFLQRALLYGAPLNSPETVAAFMASCAKEAKARLELHPDLPALERVRKAMESALNLNFQTEKADEFFRSSLVQTLFYGVFSAWVLWGRENPINTKAPSSENRFDWRLSHHYIKVPVLRALFYELANPDNMESLGLDEPLSWVGEALTNVDRAAFDERFKDGSAVQYFYEPFLAAFDPDLRKQLGVWYTPPEVVRYMVARVDTLLREELGLEKGLADENVVLLDPCCGTGGFLVEVIHHIHRTLEKNNDALMAAELKAAVLERIYGFEILTAPFVVAHLQIGLLLQTLGAPLKGNQRAPIFLTNALTGWSEPDGEQLKIDLPGLQQEREAADEVKRNKKILVILGNPPYDGYAGIAMGEERDLSGAYRTTIDKDLPKPEGQGLNELYVRFFRMAERKIVEDSGAGVVCFISNYSWLEGKSHTGMREAYARRFSRVWIDNLNGDRYSTGKVAPDGAPDPSIFSTPSNKEGIQVGTAIASLVRHQKRGDNSAPAELQFRNLWGTGKLAQLQAEARGELEPEYSVLDSPVALGLPFKPAKSHQEYSRWPRLPELFPVSFPGVTTGRDEFVVDIEKEKLVARMEKYFDSKFSNDEIRVLAPTAMSASKRFEPLSTRKHLLERGLLPENAVRYSYRPMDTRWIHWEPETKLLDEKRTEYWPHVFNGNAFLFTTGRIRKHEVEPPLFVTALNDYNCMDSGARGFPLYLRDLTTAHGSTQSGLAFEDTPQFKTKPNLSAAAQAYLQQLGGEAAHLFYHALAIQHAPAYREENADALRLDWPRIPLPASGELLHQSSQLGREVAALLDTLAPVSGVTGGTLREELRLLGSVARDDAGSSEEIDLGLNAGWGYRNPSGAVMPGTGKTLARDWTPQERAALVQGASILGVDETVCFSHLGPVCFDIRLNDTVVWKAVPSRVWEYSLGGYRVLKKWLSYREEKVLGRPLAIAEAREFSAIARRIAALLLLEPQLDANYAATIAATRALNE